MLKVRDYRSSSATGTPRAYDPGLFKSPFYSTGYRPRPMWTGDTPKLFNRWEWTQQITLARQIFARSDVVHGAVCQKNLYAVGCGWRFHYTGPNTKWGAEAEEYLNEIWYPTCDIRGEPYDFWTDLYLDACALDRDGDEAMVLQRPQDLGDYEGPLRLSWVAAHRIADGEAETDKNLGYAVVEKGEFKGKRICNGVIKDENNTTIGYRIVGDSKEDQRDLPANSCQLLYEPDWNDLHRGIPRTAVSCLNWLDTEDINHFLKRQVKLDSSQGITIENEKGGPMNPSRVIASEEIPESQQTDATVQDLIIEPLVGNEINYFKSMTGGKIAPIESNRPSPNVEAFVRRIETSSLFSIGWFRQLLDPSEIGGASVRAIQDEARHAVEWRQRTIRKRAMRATIAALADAQTRGVISTNDAERWWLKCSFTLPALLTVDAGYDEKADLEQLANGTTTRSRVAGKKGFDWDTQIRPANRREVTAIIEDAQAIAAEKGIPFELALNMLTKLPNNGTLQPEQEQKANDDEKKK